MERALRALNRFGTGARPGEAGRVREPRGWLREQLRSPDRPRALDRPTPGSADAAGVAPPPAGAAEAGGALRALRRARRADDREAVREARKRITGMVADETRAGLERRLNGPRPFVERLTAFWSNHLCVSARRGLPVALLAGSYEREAIRPHVLGRFEEMLLASARHPAMLLYLDNARSVGPNAPAVRRRAGRDRRVGLNENYARELLELHTLGVDGGYGQEDVEELARVLTGWTVAGIRPVRREEGPVRFSFRSGLHEPGARTVLGRRYPGGGPEQGEAVLRDLARHPSTARHLATKLVRHFGGDRPDPAEVERVAGVFRDTGGDLRRVSTEVVELPSAWDPETRKFRSPQDWLTALMRALGVRRAADPLPGVLRQLRHGLWSPPSPAGFGDTREHWADPDALLNRAELARTVSRRVAGAGAGRASERAGRRTDPLALLEVMETSPGDPLRTLLGDETLPAGERLSLALAAPAFQWR